MTEPPLLLALDLAGTLVFAVNGALTGDNADKSSPAPRGSS
jgi:hypothetical protein